ncbi:MAG TPA: hypothetical protein VLG47_02140 [Candidatus Saccharimonadales bacterium]|nr:hypothetical protein [Candidatus Saccharimonadales bacterium]
MKKFFNKWVVISILAVLFSACIVRWSSVSNVSACVESPGCANIDKQPLGTLSHRMYGYPLAYRSTVTFEPANNNSKSPNYAGYSSASTELEGFSYVNLAVNFIFWFSLLYMIASHLPKSKSKPQPKPINPDKK